MGTFEALGMELDLTARHHDRARHNVVTLATPLAILVVIVLAAVQFSVLLKVPTGQLLATTTAPAHSRNARAPKEKANKR